MRHPTWVPWVFALAVVACGDEEGGSTTRRANAPPGAGEAVLLNQSGELAASDTSDARGRFDSYFVPVAANDRVVVSLRSRAFDPSLEVTPPGSGALTNDDWQGDRTRSELDLLASTAGQMKVEVRSYRGQGQGAYTLTVRRVARDGAEVAGAAVDVPVLTSGQNVDGELGHGDHTLSSGELFDSFVVRVTDPARVTVTASGTPPRTTLVGPGGLTLQATGGRYEASDDGTYRLQVIGARGLRYRVQVSGSDNDGSPLLARAHHQFNALVNSFGSSVGTNPSQPQAPAPAPAPGVAPPPPSPPLMVRLGDHLTGNLAQSDATLPSGEHYDIYELTVAQPAGDATVQMESTAIDSFLRVEGPNGQHWENDDAGGTLNASVDVTLAQPGTYRIVTTTYRAGETGPYQLKVLTRRAQATVTAVPAQPGQRFDGSLRPSDRRFRGGNFYYDEFRFRWRAGERFHLEAQSTDLDTYMVVLPPRGAELTNDDLVPGQNLNAGMDLQVNQSGQWRVRVSSYREFATGDYTLVVGGAGAAPPTAAPSAQPIAGGPGAHTQAGTLAQGDSQLQSGEFRDNYSMTFTPQSAVSIRLDSSDFDTYLIVRSPSGAQEDNDDIQSGNFNSGLDIPVAEPGAYQITVTSYRPGETGAYRLSVTEGQSVVAAPTGTSGGGRVWGLFAGITDYPGGMSDLPECANDARKLAEAVRNQGNMPRDQEFLMTDGQATTASVRQAMQAIAQRIRPDDVFVFFYSGHGGQTQSSRDTRELDSRDEYLVLADGQMMDDELGQLFDQMRARISLVAIDACFAGGFGKDIITRPGRVGMFSSEEDVMSAVAGRFQAGGYLSHFLRVGIEGEADSDPQNQIMTVGELTHYTWVQFGRHASDVRMSMGYQHLVVDRGAVHTNEVLWAVRR